MACEGHPGRQGSDYSATKTVRKIKEVDSANPFKHFNTKEKERLNKGKPFANMFPGKISQMSRAEIKKAFIINYEI